MFSFLAMKVAKWINNLKERQSSNFPFDVRRGGEMLVNLKEGADE